MRLRRIAAFFLGMWLAGTLFMLVSLWQTEQAADRVLFAPVTPAAAIVASLGQDRAHAVIRYLALEQQRFTIELWEDGQIFLGVMLLGLLLLDGRSRRLALGAAALLFVLLVEKFALTPQMLSLDRVVDFVSWSEKAGIRTQVELLRRTYIAVEIVKILAVMVMAYFLFKLRVEKRRSSRVEGLTLDLARPRPSL